MHGENSNHRDGDRAAARSLNLTSPSLNMINRGGCQPKQPKQGETHHKNQQGQPQGEQAGQDRTMNSKGYPTHMRPWDLQPHNWTGAEQTGTRARSHNTSQDAPRAPTSTTPRDLGPHHSLPKGLGEYLAPQETIDWFCCLGLGWDVATQKHGQYLVIYSPNV